MFALDNFDCIWVGSIELPVLMPLITKPFLQGGIGSISREQHIRKSQHDLIPILLFMLEYPHLVRVVLVSRTQFKRSLIIVGLVGSFQS